MRVLVTGSQNAENLGTMLGYYGVEVTYERQTRPFMEGLFDVFLVFGVRPRNVLYAITGPGVKVFRFQGSDGFNPRPFIKQIMRVAPGYILYASEELQKFVGLPGEVLVTPINTRLFREYPEIERDKEVLYYCPVGREEIYCLESCPENATVLDGSTPYGEMPLVYSRHKKYVRNSAYDANPKMPYEALLCGCEVWMNGERVQSIPQKMLMDYSIPRWIDYMEEIKK
jgi:hypothetical protein